MAELRLADRRRTFARMGMRAWWPWVSRSSLAAAEERIAFFSAQCQALRADLNAARDREERWVSRCMALTSPPTPTTPSAAPATERRASDDVLDAIHVRSGNNPALRSLLARWAMKERRKGTSDDDIIKGLMEWGTTSGDPEQETGVPA